MSVAQDIREASCGCVPPSVYPEDCPVCAGLWELESLIREAVEDPYSQLTLGLLERMRAVL